MRASFLGRLAVWNGGRAAVLFLIGFYACGGADGPVTPVVDPPSIELSQSTVDFAAREAGSSPVAQALSIANGGGGTLDGLAVAVSYGDGEPPGWLDAALSSTTAPSALALTPDVGALLRGVYGATLQITADDAEVVPQNVAVRFDVRRSAASFIGTYILDPVPQMTCPMPDVLAEYEDLLLESIAIFSATDTEFEMELSVRAGSEPLSPASATVPVDLLDAFEASGEINFTLSGTGYTISGEGALSFDGEFIGDDQFVVQLGVTLYVTVQTVLGNSEGPCTDVSIEVTGTR